MARSLFTWALATLWLVSLVRPGSGAEAIPWTTDLRAAQQSATSDDKLLLLHFYSDNCRPCKTVERNVFSQLPIAAAISRNYVPVKVHVDSMPQVAQHYHVEAWPTDLILTSGGVEVFRTISPQSPSQYQTMLDQVAIQVGVGAARQGGDERLIASSDRSQRADVSLAAATAPMGPTPSSQPSNQFEAPPPTDVAPPFGQGFPMESPSSATLTNPYTQQRQVTGNRYAGQPPVQRQVAPPANAAIPPSVASRYSPSAVDRWSGQMAIPAAPPAVPPLQGSIYDDPQPTITAPAPQPAVQPQRQTQQQQQQRWAPTTQAPPAIPPARSVYDPEPRSQWPSDHPSYRPAPSAPQMNQRTSAQVSAPKMVEASKAPPIALDGFCPVTIMESTKWQKGNVNFGAIHLNRTYLFASAEAQRKFLADPDRYAPALFGCDPVIFAETNQLVGGSHNIGLLMSGRTYFFASEETLARFKLSPQAYAARVSQAMNGGLVPNR